jgi:alanine racemase
LVVVDAGSSQDGSGRATLSDPSARDQGVEDDQALLTIDLGAIVENWRTLAARVAPAEAGVSVKADAYGLGMARVAPALASAGVKTFFVASAREGAELRELLPGCTIYVLSGVAPGGAAAMHRHDLRPCLCSLDQIATWRAAGQGRPAALHVDTGINRLGLPPDEVAELAADRSLFSGFEIPLVMSHLACADEPNHALNRRQLGAFRAALGALDLATRPTSLAASSGIFLGPEFHFDMVRPGASIYGLAPLIGHPNPMRQVIKLEGKIIQVRRVDRGMTVGYGATHSVGEPGRIAVVGLGYADGFLRALGNRGYGVLGGQRIPVVGRVSMDLITLDVSAIPPGLARPGALVELVGPLHSVDELAAEAGTTGYEMLTVLGGRYRRVYLSPEGADRPPT